MINVFDYLSTKYVDKNEPACQFQVNDSYMLDIFLLVVLSNPLPYCNDKWAMYEHKIRQIADESLKRCMIHPENRG